MWAAGVAALLLTVPWFRLMSFVFARRLPSWPFWVPLLLGCVWAVIAWSLIRYWTAARDWDDMHRWALVFGATVASMLCGFSGSSTWPKVDLIGKIVLNLLAVVGFVLLARRLRQTTAEAGPSETTGNFMSSN